MSIREIKPRKNRFGTIISYFVDGVNTPDDAANLGSIGAFSAFVAIHTLGNPPQPNVDGVTYITHRVGPRLKSAIGHYISQIRGEQLIAFVNPSTRLIEDATRIYQYADSYRMERAFGFFAGNPENPTVVGFSAAIMPHLFHAVPEQMDVGGEWLKWMHKWAPRAMMPHRYFDANGLIAVADVEVKPAESYEIVSEPIVVPEKAQESVLVEKRKAGRPKKKAK
jgi:hypothetical protein